MQVTGTNRPRAYTQTSPKKYCYASTVQYLKQHTPPHNSVAGALFHRVTAATAVGKRPVPFRTRKLSLPAPMVLHSRGCGRVGHRRTQLHTRTPNPSGLGFSSFRSLHRATCRAREGADSQPAPARRHQPPRRQWFGAAARWKNPLPGRRSPTNQRRSRAGRTPGDSPNGPRSEVCVEHHVT